MMDRDGTMHPGEIYKDLGYVRITVLYTKTFEGVEGGGEQYL